MKKLIAIILILISFKGVTQTSGFLRYDSTFSGGGINSVFILNKAANKDSTGYVLTNIGHGVTGFRAAAAGGIATASNGLTLTGSNVKLGGALTANTTVTPGAFSLTFSSSTASGLFFNRTAAATTGAFNVGNLVTNSTTGSTFSDGFGGLLEWENKGVDNVYRNIAGIEGVRDGNDSSGRLKFLTFNAGVLGSVGEFSKSGQLKLNNYGSGTFTGTPTKSLQVDVSGNIIEGSINSGSLTNITATNNFAQTWTITNPTSTPNLSLVLDTNLLSTRAWRQKGIDSVSVLITPKIDTTNILQTASYVIEKIGTTTYARPAYKSGLAAFSGTASATVINAAIAALGAISRGTIYFRNFTYTISAKLISGSVSNVNLIGEGGAKLKADSALNDHILDITSVSHWKILYLEFDGNTSKQTSRTTDPSCIDVNQCTDVVVDKCYLHDGHEYGIYIRGSSSTYCGIQNSTVTLCDWNCISFGNSSSGCFTINNNVSHTGDVGISTYGYGTQIINNYVHDIDGSSGSNNGRWGIATESGFGNAPYRNVIDGNTVANTNSGIVASTGTDSSFITHNSIYAWDLGNGFLPGIWVIGNSNTVNDNFLFKNFGTAAVCFNTSGNKNTFSGNTVYGTHGFDMGGTGSDNIVNGNTIVASSAAILIENSTNNRTVVMNNDWKTSGGDISDAGTSTIFSNNIYKDGILHTFTLSSPTVVTGTLPIANGGTNNGSLSVTAGTVYYGDGTKLLGLAPGTSSQILHSGTTPSWKDTTASSSGITALTGDVTASGSGSVVATLARQLAPTAVKTANYSAAINDFIPCNDSTNAGNFTVTLPTTPADKSIIGVKIVIHTAGDTVKVVTGGSDLFNRTSGATQANLTLLNQAILLQYKSSTGIWYVISTDAPISAFLSSTGTLGAIPSFSPANTQSNITAVASGSLLASAGTSTLPSWSASPTLTTSLTTPLLIGGSGTTSTLTFKTTTGVGTTNADMIFQVGNNGATEAMRILNSGKIGMGVSPAEVLDVNGNIQVRGNHLSFVNAGNSVEYFRITPGASTTTIDGLTHFINFVNARIGIGVVSPTALLHMTAGTATASTASGKIDPGLKLATAENGAIESDTTGGVYHLYWTNKSLARLQLDNSGVTNYFHTIFTPTTGQTITTINNQYNIVNPAGALLALTVNLPSSPANNDVVYIKFTQTITTVTYANGTVVDGIAGPAAGGLVVLTYDSGTTSWY